MVLLAHCLNPSEALLNALGQGPPLDDDLPDEPEPLGIRQLKQIQHRLPIEQIMELVRQYEAGSSASELAKTFRIDQSTVHGHLKRQDAKHRPYRKLRGADLERARRLHDEGWSFRAIALELGLNRQTVARAVREDER